MTSEKDIKALLNNNHDWPTVYTFKFIVKGDLDKIALVQDLFNSETAQISMRESSKGNYISVTAKEVMNSAQEILDVYTKAKQIEGLIAL